jgi:hypothetical protein
VTARRPPPERSEGADDFPITPRRFDDGRLEPRARALFLSFSEWLPRDVAWDRAMNAAAPVLMLEGYPPPDRMSPRVSIASALANVPAMKGSVATPARIEAAVRAWARAASQQIASRSKSGISRRLPRK